MPLANTPGRYGVLSQGLHWLTALLVLVLLALGVYARMLPFDTAEALAHKARAFSLHKTLGVAVFFLSLLRIAWMLSQPRPTPLHPGRRLELWLADTVHWLLYGSLLMVPLAGWVFHAASTGFAPIWWPFGQSLPLMAKSEPLAFAAAGVHLVLVTVLAGAISLHVAGALKHHFVDGDATLRRMWPGAQADAPGPAGQRGPTLALASALAVWAAALAMGGALDLYRRDTTTIAAGTLGPVESEWTVQDGTVALTVQLFGKPLSGTLADWTAAIRFDPSITSGRAGSVEATLSIASLTLGSVTAQALGPDYFDAPAFPTARFIGDLIRSDTGDLATGNLALKGRTVPVTLPVTIAVDGDVATATGTVTLERSAFGIGDRMSDPAMLGFDVVVEISLSARNTAAR